MKKFFFVAIAAVIISIFFYNEYTLRGGTVVKKELKIMASVVIIMFLAIKVLEIVLNFL